MQNILMFYKCIQAVKEEEEDVERISWERERERDREDSVAEIV